MAERESATFGRFSLGNASVAKKPMFTTFTQVFPRGPNPAFTTFTMFTRQRPLNSASSEHGISQTMVSKMVETTQNVMLDLTNQLCACKTWFVI